MISEGNIYPSGGQAGEVFNAEGIYPTVQQGKRGGKAAMPPVMISWQNSDDGAIVKEESPSLRASGGTDIRKRPVVALTEQRTPEAKELRRQAQKNGKDWAPRRGKELVPRQTDDVSAIQTSPTKEHMIVESALIHGRGLESRKDGVSHSLKGAEGGYSKNFAILRLDENESIEHRLYDSEGLAPSLPTGATGGNLIPKIANTVTDGWLMDTSHHSHPMNQYRIRRLTPVECERLQGFPDGWTAGVSDTQRYKMMGNAVTVNVIQAIGEKILEAVSEPSASKALKEASEGAP